jgi:hypothetical protein
MMLYIFSTIPGQIVTYINIVIIININIICIVDVSKERLVFPPLAVPVTILPHYLLIYFRGFAKYLL